MVKPPIVSIRGSGNLIRDVLSSTCSIPLNKLHMKINPKLKYPQELRTYFFPHHGIEIDAIRITCLSPCLLCSAEKEVHPINSTEIGILEEVRMKISKTRGNHEMVKESSICATCRKTVGKLAKLRGQVKKIETCVKFAIRRKLDKLEEEGNKNPSRFKKSEIIPFPELYQVSNSPSISYLVDDDPPPSYSPPQEADDDDPPPSPEYVASTPEVDAPISDPASIPENHSPPPEIIPADAQFPLILSSEEDEMYSVIVIKSSELANVLRDPTPLQELLNKQNSQAVVTPLNPKQEATTEQDSTPDMDDTPNQENSIISPVRKIITRKNPKKSKKAESPDVFVKTIKKPKRERKVGRPRIHKIKSEPLSPPPISPQSDEKMDTTREKARCNFCMMEFAFPGILRVHERSKAHKVGVKGHREKPDGSVVFGCDRCEFETITAEKLLRHKIRRLKDKKHN